MPETPNARRRHIGNTAKHIRNTSKHVNTHQKHIVNTTKTHQKHIRNKSNTHQKARQNHTNNIKNTSNASPTDRPKHVKCPSRMNENTSTTHQKTRPKYIKNTSHVENKPKHTIKATSKAHQNIISLPNSFRPDLARRRSHGAGSIS